MMAVLYVFIVAISVFSLWYWVIIFQDITLGRNYVEDTWDLPVLFLMPACEFTIILKA